MNASDIQARLGSIIGGGDPELEQVAQEASAVTAQYQQNQLSQSEYQELISDLQEEKLFTVTATNLAAKEELSALFDEIKSAVSVFQLL